MTIRYLAAVLTLLLLATVSAAQETVSFNLEIGRRHEFTGTVSGEDDMIYLNGYRLLKGDTFYLFVQGGGSFTPAVAIYDIRNESFLFFDDRSGRGGNLNVQYEVPQEGTYVAVIFSTNGAGDYRIIVGINEPDILNEAISDASLNSGFTSATTFSCDTATLAEYPTLSGPEEQLMSPEFIVHYTTQGVDATTPEYAMIILEVLDNSARRHHELGWALPPADCGEGGDNRLDVYIVDLLGTYGAFGVAIPGNIIGDNPNTPTIELTAGYSHLEIDNDMILPEGEDPGDIDFGDPLMLARTTTAHEFHHNVQFGYDAADQLAGNAFYEWGAMWMEQQVSGGDDVLAAMTNAYLDTTDECIASYMGRMDGPQRIYGEWLMLDSLIQDKGEIAYITLWQQLILEQGLLGFYNGLAALSTTPQEVIERVAVRSLLRDFATAAKFPEITVRLETVVKGIGMYFPVESGIQQLGADYVHIAQPGLWLFEINGRGLNMLVVGIDKETQTASVHHVGRVGVVDTTIYDDAYLIVLNTQQHTDIFMCEYVDWNVNIGDGTGYAISPIAPEVWDASQFIAPSLPQND